MIFVGKRKAKKDFLLKKQEELLAQQNLRLQQLQLQQQQLQQRQLQQPSHSNQNLLNPKITNLQFPQTSNDINAQIPAIVAKPFNSSNYYIHQTSATTSSKTTAVTASLANVPPLPTNLNSHLNEILIPAPVNSTSYVQQYSKNSQNPGFSKQNGQLKIDLKDFESEQDPFENLSLKVINDIEELDKVFHGTNALASKTTALTTPSATITTAPLATSVYKPSPLYTTNDLLQNQQQLLLHQQQQQQQQQLLQQQQQRLLHQHQQQQPNFYEIPKFTQKSFSPLTVNNNNHHTIGQTSSSSSSFYTNNNNNLPCTYIQQNPTNIIDNNIIIANNPDNSFYNNQYQQQNPTYNTSVNDFKHYNNGHNPFTNQSDKLYTHFNSNTFTNQNLASVSIINNARSINAISNDINNKNALYYSDVKNINGIDDFGSSILDKYFYNKYVLSKNNNLLINQQPITSSMASQSSLNMLRQAKSTSDLTKLNNDDDDSCRRNYDNFIAANDDGADCRFVNFPKIVPSNIGVRSGQISDARFGFDKQNSSTQHFYGRFTPPIMKTSETTAAFKNPHSHIASPSHVSSIKMIKSKPKSYKEELVDRIILMGFSEVNVSRAVAHFGLNEPKCRHHHMAKH
ncbi:hypothetical protein HELRODRAFT_188234 [Helobdella robusta]|uniref:UBA domain-containing protein n=1 Tax=Helobdella robusta TaxID=6412 RepID=T1FPS9_HELRO|nr:hypothetical protein HELRODRAFT_188234 [Helobdella robusta]ESO05943.1 hypothetical protein HELRODRAFT_188234 [Helobdella robusta]